MTTPLILAIDQGTSATKCLLVDAGGAIVARSSAALAEHYPQPGWVEQDGNALWASVLAAVDACLSQQPRARIVGVGISNQRESMLLWDRASGAPVSPLISWQDQRTVALADELRNETHEALVRERSGLPLDPMFSALKARWLLDRYDPARERCRRGDWCLGTVDSFLLSRIADRHVGEIGNASRTQLLNVHSATWDAELQQLFDVPLQALPELRPSVGPFGDAARLHPALAGVPVLAAMGDSHAALYAHGAWQPGAVKATLGTGSSVMGLVAAAPHMPHHPGVCLTIAWDDGNGPARALEGNIRAAGATLRWDADLFGMTPDDAAALAARSTSHGVSLVPAFNGLAAPWWDAHAVGIITGLTLATDRGALLAATIDSIAHQVADVLDAMDHSIGGLARLLVDGGPSRDRELSPG